MLFGTVVASSFVCLSSGLVLQFFCSSWSLSPYRSDTSSPAEQHLENALLAHSGRLCQFLTMVLCCMIILRPIVLLSIKYPCLKCECIVPDDPSFEEGQSILIIPLDRHLHMTCSGAVLTVFKNKPAKRVSSRNIELSVSDLHTLTCSRANYLDT